jgi:hypothetical protein
MESVARTIFVTRRIVRNALIRFRRTPLGSVLQDFHRARRLRRADAPPRKPVERVERIVVTLTSIADRAGTIAPALRSLLDQTIPADRVILAWPTHSLRTGLPNPELLNLPEGIEVLRCDDLGPATKLLPALVAEPDALLIVVDDDVIYPVDFIETLISAHRLSREAAVGYRGWRLEGDRDPKDLDHVFATALVKPEEVDILFGTWGYLIPPGALDEAVQQFSGWPAELRWVDDVWVSGHLARRGVPRLVVPAKRLPLETAASAIGALTDGLNRSGSNDRIAIKAFAPWR